jgi:diguanylate cyclase (GGDEF)-like protein
MRPDAHTSGYMVRARRTAAVARGAMSLCALALVWANHGLAPNALVARVGFALIAASAVIQFRLTDLRVLRLEESMALPAFFIVALGHERVNILSLLWVGAVASGVLARGGRVHWVGRAVVIVSVALPVILTGRLSLTYAAFVIAVFALLLTCGRITQELSALLARARHDADHDMLTGSLSRAAFRARLDARARQARAGQARAEELEELALLLVDLNGFGQINKALGHATGDGLLAEVAAILQRHAADDGLVGRVGGDEFGVLLTSEDPKQTAGTIIAELEALRPAVGACIGIARTPQDGHDAESLLRAADIALRVAKRAGRDQVSLYAGDSLSDAGPNGARAALKRLIAGENLTIVVQPIIHLASGRAHAFEALARFESGATSSPLHWFALAEEFGLRPELELACLEAALSLLEELPEDALLSVNLSGSLLLDPRTLGLLAEPLDVSRLIVELTENTLVEDTPELHLAVEGLRRRGAQLAVDDMGAGYSGLRQITTVEARYLKLDRSLITGIDSSPGRQALVAALVGYAERIGGALVAEGIETEPELAAVRQLGVPLVQGYLLGRPAPPWPAANPCSSASLTDASRPFTR